MSTQLSPRMEDYLETILELLEKQPVARVSEISKELGVSKSTVTSALNNLVSQGLIIHQSYGYIELTAKGRQIAEKVRWRHQLLRKFFESVLGIDSSRACQDACHIEHYISDETLDKLTLFIEFIHECPITGKEWLEKFHCHSQGPCTDIETAAACKKSCLQKCKQELGDNLHLSCRKDI